MFQVTIVGDDAFTLSGVRDAITQGPDADARISVVTPECLTRIRAHPAPDIFIVCVNVVTTQTIESLCQFSPVGGGRRVPVLVLTTNADERTRALLRFGFCVILRQHVQPYQLGAIARLVAAGYLFAEIQDFGALLREADHLGAHGEEIDEITRKLTQREQMVFELVAQGMTNPEVACALSIARSTVKSHVESILQKLGLRSRTQIAFCARSRKLPGAEIRHLTQTACRPSAERDARKSAMWPIADGH